MGATLTPTSAAKTGWQSAQIATTAPIALHVATPLARSGSTEESGHARGAKSLYPPDASSKWGGGTVDLLTPSQRRGQLDRSGRGLNRLRQAELGFILDGATVAAANTLERLEFGEDVGCRDHRPELHEAMANRALRSGDFPGRFARARHR